MALEEYKRKRRFEDTPEPPPKVEKKSSHRFVVQKHRATRLHYDFRLEMEGVLKSWAVPKGPSLDPADKRLAMQVEDHPVSYFDFEGTIPEGNYGAGSVMVWDVGTWEPLSAVAVQGKYNPGTDAEASAMLKKGDLKFRLHGKRLKGDFALVHMRARRPRSKGTEWLLIKKHDDAVVEGYDIDQYDSSVLTKRTMAEIGGDEDSAEWTSSRPASRGKLKAPWLAKAVAKLDQKKRKAKTEAEKPLSSVPEKKNSKSRLARTAIPTASPATSTPSKEAPPTLTQVRKRKNPEQARSNTALSELEGIKRGAMPVVIHPMLATPISEAFDSPNWLFEIKWDGYRAVAFIRDGTVRLVSRNQNDLTGQFPELASLAGLIKAKEAVIDGEIVALDEQGRPSFSLMQQKTGFRPGKHRTPGKGVPIVYYAFDLLYADGYDLRRVTLEQRKSALQSLIETGDEVRYSDHYLERGNSLLEVARGRGLEGIVAKRHDSQYEERRTRAWLKIKITQTLDCVIGGYTEPEGSREYFGSIVLGLYNEKKQLVHVGQAGSGFDQIGLREMWKRLKSLETKENPFHGPVESGRPTHWVKPELVAEIKFSEWTHATSEGGLKLRAPVFLRSRADKKPRECVFEDAVNEPAT